jgi:hypothetical protein
MATESQKQKRLLDNGFLDNLGSKDVPLKLDKVEKIFVKYMGKLVDLLQVNLNTASNGKEITASGALSESIRFEYRKDGTGYVGEVYMLDYADYVDKGVQGIGPGNRNTTSPYHFKTAFPSKDMQKALLLWVRQKSLLAEREAPKGLKGKATRTYLRNKVRANDLAIRIGIGIKRHGTKATNFKQVSVDAILDDMTRELAKATATDIAVNINTSILR